MDTHKMEEDDYVTVSHEGGVHDEVDLLIEPNQGIAVGPVYNNYVGTKWIMVNRLKVMVRQGDLVDALADVIVNPANSELCHGDGAARAILVAAGKELGDECNKYIRQFGTVKVGKLMCTTAGNLKPRKKYVIQAVGPNAGKNNNRQECFELVQSTVLYGLEYAEHVLNSASIAVPAISSGLFGVPKILQNKYSKRKYSKILQLVNLDRNCHAFMLV